MTAATINPIAAPMKQSDVDEIISYNVKMLLADRGISQTSLGEAMGIKRSGMSLKLSGRSTWYATDMVNAARFFDISLDALTDDTLMKQMQALKSKKAPTGDRSRLSEGAPAGIRTLDTLIKSQLHSSPEQYQYSPAKLQLALALIFIGQAMPDLID